MMPKDSEKRFLYMHCFDATKVQKYNIYTVFFQSFRCKYPKILGKILCFCDAMRHKAAASDFTTKTHNLNSIFGLVSGNKTKLTYVTFQQDIIARFK